MFILLVLHCLLNFEKILKIDDFIAKIVNLTDFKCEFMLKNVLSSIMKPKNDINIQINST